MTAAAVPALHVHGLEKSFKELHVLRGVDFDVATGSIFALLGSNGAGKTTVVRILSTLLKPDAGTVTVVGHDVVTHPAEVRESISLTGQFAAVDEILTGRENLLLMARLWHRKDGGRLADELLTRFQLGDAADRRVATYSGGMRRRLDLAMSLIGDPPIIFLDEPTTGLDPRSRHVMWDIVRGLVADGVTILLTTQNLEEADELADRIALLDRSRIVAAGTPAELKRLIPGGHLLLRFADRVALHAAASRLGAMTRDDEALTLQVPSDGGVASLRAVLNELDESIEVESLSICTPDLDDVFFALTGRTEVEGAVP